MSQLTKRRRLVPACLLILLPWAILATSCSEGNRPRGPRAALTNRDFALEAVRIKKALGENFIVEVKRPFVIAGNIPRSQFERIKNGTILGSYRAFYKQLFTVKPTYMIKVFLFKDDATYRDYARRLFGDEPTTPFGYYKSESHSLVMNIATGTGTLVHEMTHSLIEADFPDVPAWFNEGLGSLFEQCLVTPHGLKGLVNWRLPILLNAIRDKRITGLRNLVSTTSAQFYRDERGTHYAEARYFCMYLQEIGLLETFYKKFRANFKRDPTGEKTIEKLFGKSLEQIQQNWLDWVGRLRPAP